MTFYVDTRFKKEFELQDFSFNNNPSVEVYWVFMFANGDIEKIDGTTTSNNTAIFEIPDDFFTEARIGELQHQLLVKDADDVPTIFSEYVKDKLIRGSPTLGELGL